MRFRREEPVSGNDVTASVLKIADDESAGQE
jgi:hypothetical protein